MIRCAGFALLPLLLIAACSSSSSDPTPPAAEPPAKIVKPAPAPMAPLASVKTTVDATFSPAKPNQTYRDGPNPSAVPADLRSYLDRGFGDLVDGPGQPYVVHTIDGSTPPAPGANAKRVLRFAHLSDLQLSDDESPTRLGTYDSADLTSSALRPQDPDICRMTNAAVRTINALHRKDPIAFTLMGGDNADSAQSNEVDWVLQILGGSPLVQCDSGDVDDPVPGVDNDGKDPFVAEGLAMPWKWNTGNHDVLIQGNLPVIADKDGHGLGADQMASGRATYTFDADGSPFRFLVLDTAHEVGGADGVIKQAYVDSTIKPLLDKAKADGKYVILASHHATGSLTQGGGAFGVNEPDALLEAQWTAFIGSYPNVLFSMVGHSHQHRVRALTPTGGGHAWFEVMTAAIADYPHELRVVEMFDQDNGWIMMRATAVDLSVEGDNVAKEGRRKGTVDLTSGWQPDDGRGKVTERNVELWIKKPQ